MHTLAHSPGRYDTSTHSHFSKLLPDDLGGYPLAGGKEVMKQEKDIILSSSIIYMLINMLKL